MNQDTIKSPFSILFVDDEENARKYFNKGLKHEYNVMTASGIDEAKQILEEHHHNIAIVITDQRMPGGNGVILLKFLREHYPHIIRLLTTAYSDLTEAIEAVNSGEIFRYIQKPWDYHLLKTEMGQAMELFELRFERTQMLNEKVMVKRNLMKVERVKALILMAKSFNFIKNTDASIQDFIRNFANVPQEDNLDGWNSFDFGNKDILETNFLGKIIDTLQQSLPYSADYEFNTTLTSDDIICGFKNTNLNIGSNLTSPEEIKVNSNSFNLALQKLSFISSLSQENATLVLDKIDNGVCLSFNINKLQLAKGGNIFIANPEKTDIEAFYTDLLICFLVFGHHGGIMETDLEGESLKINIKLPSDPERNSFVNNTDSESLENTILSAILC